MIVTIHQPDMMPWLGFFNKINNADVWVVLDHTENNPRDAAFWGRRVKILLGNEGKWLSLPLEKVSGKIGIPIENMEFVLTDPKPYDKAIAQIENAYRKAPFYDEVIALCRNFILSTESSLLKRNMNFINEVLKILEIDTKIIYSSSLNCQEKSTDLLVEIAKRVKADVYLAGGGAGGYQNDEMFEKHNITLKYNNFKHPIYAQGNAEAFVSGLSVIDSLMYMGVEETKRMIKQTS